MYYENKFKQSLSIIPSISTKRTTTYHATEIIENKKQKRKNFEFSNTYILKT